MPEPKTSTYTLAAKDPEKKHSRVFEVVGDSDIAKSIYFLRPWCNGAKRIKITAEIVE